MTAGQTITLRDQRAVQAAHRLIDKAPEGAVVNIREAKRTGAQNDLMWTILSAISRAKPGGRSLTPDTWKALFMHACGHAVQFEHGLSGEPFPLGFRSSRLSKAQMTDLIEFMLSWAAENGVTI